MAVFVQNGLGNIARVEDGNVNIRETARARESIVERASTVQRGVEEDADAFDGVTHAADQKVTAQRAGETHAGAGAGFVVEIAQAQVIRLPVIEVQSQSQLAS